MPKIEIEISQPMNDKLKEASIKFGYNSKEELVKSILSTSLNKMDVLPLSKKEFKKYRDIMD